MRKFLFASLTFAAAMFIAANAFATYYVVLKNGTTYKAKAKWTMVGGKAQVMLETGQVLQLDPGLIDEAKSESITKSGLGDAQILAVGQPTETAAPQRVQSALGNLKLRKLPPANQAAPTTPPPTAGATPANGTAPAMLPVATGGPLLATEIVEKFGKAYENVGLFEQKLQAIGPHALRAELTADSEDKVFNAISATSFLMVRGAGVPGAQIDMVELFMKTTTGGSSGRFQMTKEDALALDSKKISQYDYFVHRVIF